MAKKKKEIEVQPETKTEVQPETEVKPEAETIIPTIGRGVET